jgi:hypothetical protein
MESSQKETKQKMSTKDKQKSNTTFVYLDYFVKLITPLITIFGLLIGIWQFNRQQSFNEKLEFKRKMWEKQLDAYTQISDNVSKIIIENDRNRLDSLSRKYEELYWGKLPLFTDKNVHYSMKEFREILQDHLNGIKNLNDGNLLKKSGYKLINNCQKSIHDSWIELDV